ncbi:MAG TPA: transcriptional regulator [Cytophagales bacterium]|nr:transcriptional regulator [Cytophagales bacterium]HAA18972.1 transcriptional regulator [Cytophagales bacterium]HAP60370.1 transcriptional regulator [Cytophagales bacterium]
MEYNFRCTCPITSALDVVGDRWILVIVKLMLLEGRYTFNTMKESDEGIATNILTAKLKLMEGYELIRKEKLPNNKKTNIYSLTDRGLSLTPLIIELTLWSDAHLKDVHDTLKIGNEVELINHDREGVIAAIKSQYLAKMKDILNPDT